MSEFQLDNAPSDCISAVKFGQKSSQYLLASSWDATVRLYDIDMNKQKSVYHHEKAVLDCSFSSDSSRAFSGGLDATLKMFDFNSQKETVIGTHKDAIKCVHYCASMNLIITGSWDRYIKLWDLRSSTCVASCEQPDKVFTLDTCEEKLVVGTADRKIRIWNLLNMTMPESRESSLKYQTRCIRCFPNKQGFVVSSVEGRVAIEYFDMHPEIQRQKYAFKCHRRKDNDELIYPVNAIAFHNVYNTFATGGSDGYPTAITSLAFDYSGNHLAIATSYCFENGNLTLTNKPTDSIFIRRISELETKPK